MKRSHKQLVRLIQARRAAQDRTKGIVLASDYLRDLRECVGSGVCRRYFGDGTDLAAAIKEANQKLTFSFPDNDVKEVSGNVVDFKKLVPKDLEIPEHTLLVMRNCVTTPDEDRDSDILRTSGAKPDAKMPLLWQHLHTSPIGKCIGVANHTDKSLSLWTALLDLNELTEDAAKLFEAKVLRFSHGFRALEFKERKEGVGFEITSYEIIEQSAVSVPSNVRAEVEAWSRVKFKSDFFKKAAEKKLKPHLKNYAEGVGGGITISGLNFSDLLNLNKSTQVAVKEAAEHDCGCGGKKTPVAAGAKKPDGAAKPEKPACPECESTNVSAKDGEYTCKDCGKTWAMPEEKSAKAAAASKTPGDPSPGSVGPVAPGPHGPNVYADQVDAELAADIIGCSGCHEVGGGFSPCQDAATLAEMTGETPSLPKPSGGSTSGGPAISNPPKSAVRAGVKMYIGQLEGSYQWIQGELQEDAARFLIGSGAMVSLRDYIYVAAIFDGYAIICVSPGYTDYTEDAVENCYRVSWTMADGEPTFTGTPAKVELRTTTNIVEMTSSDAVMEGVAKPKPWSIKMDLRGWNLRKQIGKAIALRQINIEKAGKVLSAANASKLADCIGDLEELSAMEGLPRAATALAKRITDTLQGILDSVAPAPPDEASFADYQKAAEAILENDDPAWLKRFAKAAMAQAQVLELNAAGAELVI